MNYLKAHLLCPEHSAQFLQSFHIPILFLCELGPLTLTEVTANEQAWVRYQLPTGFTEVSGLYRYKKSTSYKVAADNNKVACETDLSYIYCCSLTFLWLRNANSPYDKLF